MRSDTASTEILVNDGYSVAPGRSKSTCNKCSNTPPGAAKLAGVGLATTIDSAVSRWREDFAQAFSGE
jgi:hypothetical protein